MILDKNFEPKPQLVRFDSGLLELRHRVVLADSITLTPGTVTMNVTDDGLYEIHALTKGAADGLVDGGMQRKVAWLYGMPLDFEVVEEKEGEE